MFLAWNIAAAAEVRGAGHESAVTDFQYLMLLPFCNVFTSSDKLQLRWARVITQSSTEIIAKIIEGQQLKRDLEEVAAYWRQRPDEVNKYGALVLGNTPPTECRRLSGLWDDLNPGWRNYQSMGLHPATRRHQQAEGSMEKMLGRRILERIERAQRIPDREQTASQGNAEMAIRRSMRGTKAGIPLIPAASRVQKR